MKGKKYPKLAAWTGQEIVDLPYKKYPGKKEERKGILVARPACGAYEPKSSQRRQLMEGSVGF